MSEGLRTDASEQERPLFDGPAKNMDPATLLRAHENQVAFHSEQVANPNMPNEQLEIHERQLEIHRAAAMALPAAGAEMVPIAA